MKKESDLLVNLHALRGSVSRMIRRRDPAGILKDIQQPFIILDRFLSDHVYKVQYERTD